MSRLSFVFAGMLLAAAGTVTAAFDVPIDPAQSIMHSELCIAGSCDTDSSPVAGTLSIELDSVNAPTQIRLDDFDLQYTDTLEWHISWGLLGTFDATTFNGGLTYAQPGVPMGPEPIAAGNCVFVDVPAYYAGIFSYVATGVPCAALMGAGLPCIDIWNLADQGQQMIDQLAGTVTSQDRIVSFAGDIDLTSPVDPGYPDLGTVHVYGTIYGEVYVPLPGDLDDDGDVDLFDFTTFAACIAGPEVTILPPECSASTFSACDLDEDGDVDLGDFSCFSENFTG